MVSMQLHTALHVPKELS